MTLTPKSSHLIFTHMDTICQQWCQGVRYLVTTQQHTTWMIATTSWLPPMDVMEELGILGGSPFQAVWLPQKGYLYPTWLSGTIFEVFTGNFSEISSSLLVWCLVVYAFLCERGRCRTKNMWKSSWCSIETKPVRSCKRMFGSSAIQLRVLQHMLRR